MTWEEYQKVVTGTASLTFENREATDIECPECRRKIWRRTDIVLSSIPPKYVYECVCGWSGTA